LTPPRITIGGNAGRAYRRELAANLRRAAARLSPPLKSLSVAIVDDATMSRLHQKFLRQRGPTDVLTFELEYDLTGRVIDGEVIICLHEARRRVAGSGFALKYELLLYALHGMLHLCGFSDRTKSGFEAMHATEDRILTELGIGPVFHGPKSPAPPRRRRNLRRPISGAR